MLIIIYDQKSEKYRQSLMSRVLDWSYQTVIKDNPEIIAISYLSYIVL